MGLIAGTDLYGRVKKVEGTPVVTTFAMLQFLPLYPIQSFYLLGTGPTKSEGIPFIASSQSVAIHGIPLARIDRWSVGAAYVRVIFAIAFAGSFLGSFLTVVSQLTQHHVPANREAPIWFGVLAVSTVGGLLTYVCSRGPRREHLIRKYCGELLGICVDPARVSSEMCQVFEQDLSQRSIDGADEETRQATLQSLVRIRLRIAKEIDQTDLELKTDELLRDLDASMGA